MPDADRAPCVWSPPIPAISSIAYNQVNHKHLRGNLKLFSRCLSTKSKPSGDTNDDEMSNILNISCLFHYMP